MTREKAIIQLDYLKDFKTPDQVKALDMAIKALEQEPRKITYEDVKGYCKPRCLTIIDNELLYELTHPKIKALEQEPSGDLISRQAVIDLIEHYNSDGLGSVFYGYENGVKFADAVNKLPSVNPQEQIAQERYEDLCEYFGEAKDILKNRDDFKAWLARVKWHIRKAEELYRKYEQEPKTDTWSIKDVADTLVKHGLIVEQEPETGHWIAQDIHNCHTDFKCSECGYIHSFMHLYGKPTADYTYCPRCGAKMIETQESEDKK